MNNEKLVADRYKIIEKIATGGMADVYLGHDQKLTRKVAIKILSPNYASDKSFVARFKREAQILAKLNHPNIVQIYDWGRYNGSYYICMEYIQGYNLKHIIERRGMIPPRAAARYAIQICEALDVAHSNNLIHRDIKPQNILITPEDTIKVTDFGIAKLSMEDATKTLNIIGTANYISPEQAVGKIVDNRSDIYSLGVVLYEMLTADLPFRGESSIEISLKHINETPVKPSLLAPGIPSDLEKIVMRCMHKDSSLRYDSISQLRDDLTNYLKGRKLSIDKPARIITNKKSFFTRNIIGPLNFISIVSIVLAVFLIFFTIIMGTGKPEEPDIEETLLIPSLVGKDYLSVEPIFSILDIDVSVTQQFDDTPEGTILEQDPGPDTEIEPPASLHLLVSRGPGTLWTTVPNLFGLSQDEAAEYLEELGLALGETDEEYFDYLQPGLVISQDPPHGQQVEENTEVNITTSRGVQMITVPNLTGGNYYFVVSNIQSLGLEVDTELVTDYTLPPGTVTGTNPSPGTEVEIGTILKVLISINQEMVPVPNLSQQELQIAINTLASVALNYEIREVESTYSVQKGLVLAQYPLAGSSVFPNSTVIIFLGV